MSHRPITPNVIVCLRPQDNNNVTKSGSLRLNNNNTLVVKRPGLVPKTYGPFARILDKDIDSQVVFFDGVKTHVDEAFRGFRSYVIVCGSSDVGKTSTLFGNDSDKSNGIVKETLIYINEKISQNANSDVHYSIFEVCGDNIYDLLSTEKNSITINSDDKDKLIVRGCTVLPFSDVTTVSENISSALIKRVSMSTGLEKVNGSHVFLKFEFKLKTRDGKITYGEVIFVSVSSTNLPFDKNDKRFSSEFKANRYGYTILNVILEEILKNPQTPPSFRKSTLTRILKPALLGTYSSTMILNLTLDHVPLDALQSLDIANKYKKLKSNPVKQFFISLGNRRNIKNYHIPVCDINKVESMGLLPTKTESRNTLQQLYQSIEENYKQLESDCHLLSKLTIKSIESSKTVNIKHEELKLYSNEKQKLIKKLMQSQSHNKKLQLKFEKLNLENNVLLKKLEVLGSDFDAYMNNFHTIKARQTDLLNKISSLNSEQVKINNDLSEKVKMLERTYKSIKEFNTKTINDQRIFIRNLEDQNLENEQCRDKVWHSLEGSIKKFENYSQKFENYVCDKLLAEKLDVNYQKIKKAFNEFAHFQEQMQKITVTKIQDSFDYIIKNIEDTFNEVNEVFVEYENCFLLECAKSKEFLSTFDEYKRYIKLIETSSENIKDIFKRINAIQIPSTDSIQLNFPDEKKNIKRDNLDLEKQSTLTIDKNPPLVNVLSSLGNMMFETAHSKLLETGGIN